MVFVNQEMVDLIVDLIVNLAVGLIVDLEGGLIVDLEVGLIVDLEVGLVVATVSLIGIILVKVQMNAVLVVVTIMVANG
jgi:hypothetical protein